MTDGEIKIVDRTTMDIYFDQKYTTHEKRPSLKALILVTDLNIEDLPRIIQKRPKLFKQYSASVVRLGEAFHKITLRRTIGLKEIKAEAIVDSGCKGAWIVLTEGKQYFVTHALEALFDNMYPHVSRLYLNYSQMRYLLGTLQESCSGQATLTYFTVKRINPETHYVGTERLWDRDVDKDIKHMITRGLIVKVARLDFELKDKDSAILRAQISRKGLCKLKFGSFTSFYQNVVLSAIEYGLSQKKFYDKRERRVEKDTIMLHPLKIDYSFDILSPQTSRFVKKITHLYSCSIVHNGNPYFVADLCDYKNGASFGIAVLGNSVTITPVTRATPFAMWKLTREIQEIFGDGNIVEIKTRQT